MKHDFSTLPYMRVSSRYINRKIPLHAQIILSERSREVSPAYYNSGDQWEGSPYAVWQYTIAGQGRVELNGVGTDLHHGSLMIVSVPGPGCYFLPEASPYWGFAFLVMVGREAVRLAHLIERRFGALAVDIPETVRFFYEILNTLFTDGIPDPFQNSALGYRLCMTFFEEQAGHERELQHHSFDDLKSFLQQNLCRDISVGEMAEVAGFSSFTLPISLAVRWE
jgi:hypothetical protein